MGIFIFVVNIKVVILQGVWFNQNYEYTRSVPRGINQIIHPIYDVSQYYLFKEGNTIDDDPQNKILSGFDHSGDDQTFCSI